MFGVFFVVKGFTTSKHKIDEMVDSSTKHPKNPVGTPNDMKMEQTKSGFNKYNTQIKLMLGSLAN